MNIEIIPAQDSPKNILNILNDDCIQSIFLQMENIQDFLSAAETCTRFQENAKLAFRTHYKQVFIVGINEEIQTYDRSTIKVDRLQSLLSIFGHLIEVIDFDRPAEDQTLDDDVQNMIADHCGKTLKTLVLGSCNSLVNFNTRSPFQALEELEVSDTNIYNFNYYSQLRRLSVSGWFLGEFNWLIEEFPKLESVQLDYFIDLEDYQVIRFLELNPQLKSLTMIGCPQITTSIFQNIHNFTPNLEKLTFYSENMCETYDSILDICNLRNLKSLNIVPFWEIPLKRFIDSLIENNVPIEVLELHSNKNNSTSELNVSQLKLIKKLSLKKITDEMLINLIENLPELEEIIAIACTKMSIDGIKRALQCGKNLSALIIGTKKRMTMDLDDFKSVLNLAKLNSVKVTINIEDYEVDIPMDILEANRKWLDVKHISNFMSEKVVKDRLIFIND